MRPDWIGRCVLVFNEYSFNKLHLLQKPPKAAKNSEYKSKSNLRKVAKKKLKNTIPDKKKAIKKAFTLLENGNVELNKSKKKRKAKHDQSINSNGGMKVQSKNKLNENSRIGDIFVENIKMKKKKKSQTIASAKEPQTSKQTQIEQPQQSSSVIKKKKKNKYKEQTNESDIQEDQTSQKITKKERMHNVLEQSPKLLKSGRKVTTAEQTDSVNKSVSLRERMIEKLKGARFRYLNEQMYTNQGKRAKQFFENDKDAYKAYHVGYRQQVTKWPINPVDIIIRKIKKL